MDSAKLAKAERLIQKELSDVLKKETQWAVQGTIISVTDVRLSPDLSIARVQLSVFPTEKRESVRAFCDDNKAHIRFSLGRATRGKIRRVPELYFYIDEFYDRLERINELLKK